MTGPVGMFCNSNSTIELEENSRGPKNENKKKKKKKKRSGSVLSRSPEEGDNQSNSNSNSNSNSSNSNNKKPKLILNAESDYIGRVRSKEMLAAMPRATRKPESRLFTLSRQLNCTYAKSNVILNRLKPGRRAIVAVGPVASSPDGPNEPPHCGHINSRLRQRSSKSIAANGTCDNDLCQSSCSTSGSSCSRWLSAAAARPRRPEETQGLKSAAAVGRRGRQIMIRTTNNSHTEINAHHAGILFAFPLPASCCSSCLSSISFEPLKPRRESGRFDDQAQTLPPPSLQGPRGREADEQEANEQEHELQLRLQLEAPAWQIAAAASAASRHEGERTKSVASSMIDVSATCFDVIYITGRELAIASTRDYGAHYERKAGEEQSSATTLTQVRVVSIVVGGLDCCCCCCCCCRCLGSGSHGPALRGDGEEEEQASGTSTRSSVAVPSPGGTKQASTTDRASSPRVTTIETTARHLCPTIETIRCCNSTSTTLDKHAPACEPDNGLERAPKSKGDLTFKLERHDRKWLRSETRSTASQLQLESLLGPPRRIVVVVVVVVGTAAISSKGGYKRESYDRLLATPLVPQAPAHLEVALPQEGPGDLTLALSPRCGLLSRPHPNRIVTRRRQSTAPSDLTSPTCNLLTGSALGPGRAINQAADFRVAGLESEKAPPFWHQLLHGRVEEAKTFASYGGELASSLAGASSRKRMVGQRKRLNKKGKPNSRATPLKLLKTTFTMLIIMLLAQWWPFEGLHSTWTRHYPARAVSCLRLQQASSLSVLEGLNLEGDNKFDLYRPSPRSATAFWPAPPFGYHENSQATALRERETLGLDLARRRQRRLDKRETGISSEIAKRKTTEKAEYELEERLEQEQEQEQRRQQLSKASTGLSSSNYPATTSRLANTSKFNSLEPVEVNAAQADQTPAPAYKWSVVGLVGFMFIGATGNILVCMAVLRERRLQTATNYFLLSLAIADLLVCTLVMPFGIIYELYGRWPFDWRICNLWVTCDVLTCSSSILHMCFISVGRYLGIRNPLHARQANLFVSRRAVLWRIAIAWASSALIASPITMMSLYDHRNIVPKSNECAISNKYFMIFGSLIAFFIPMFVMVPSYVMTVRLLSRRAKFVRNDSIFLANSSSNNNNNNNNNQHRHSSSGLAAIGGSTNANQSETMADGPSVMAGEHHQHQERSLSCFEANPQSVGQAAGGYCRAASNRPLMMNSSSETTTTTSAHLGGGAHITRRSLRDFWAGSLSDNNNSSPTTTSHQKEFGHLNRLARVDEDVPAKAGPLLAVGHDEETLKSCRYIDELDEPQAPALPQTGGGGSLQSAVESSSSTPSSVASESIKTIVQREFEVKVAGGRPEDLEQDQVRPFCGNQTAPEARTSIILSCRRCSRKRRHKRHQLASWHCCNRCCCCLVAVPQLDRALVTVGVAHNNNNNNNNHSDKQQLDDGETLTFGGGRACGRQSRPPAHKSNNHHHDPLAIASAADQEQQHHLSSSSLVVFCRCCKQSCPTGLTNDLAAETPTTISEISERPVAGGRAMPETLPQVETCGSVSDFVENGKQTQQETGTTNSGQRLVHSTMTTTTTTTAPPPMTSALNQCPMAIRKPNATRTVDDRHHHHRARAADQICICSRRCATGRLRPQADSSNELPTISATTTNERPAALARFVAVELESGTAQVRGQGNVPRPLAGLAETTNKQQNNKPTPTNSSENCSAPLWQSFCLKSEPPLARNSGGLVSSCARICVATATTGQLGCLPPNQLQKTSPPPKQPRAQPNGYCNWQTGDENRPDDCDKLTSKLDLPHAHHCQGSAEASTNKSGDLITSGGGGLVSIRIFQDDGQQEQQQGQQEQEQEQQQQQQQRQQGQLAKWKTKRAARLNKSDEFMQERSTASRSHHWNSCDDLDQFNRVLCSDCISWLADRKQQHMLRSCLVGRQQRHNHHHDLIKSATTNLQQSCHFNVGGNQTNAGKAPASGGVHATGHPKLPPEKLLLNHNGQQQQQQQQQRKYYDCALCLLRAASSRQHLCNRHHHKHHHRHRHRHRHQHNKMSHQRDHHHHHHYHHHGHHHDCLRRTSSDNKRKLAPDLASSDGNKAATQSNCAGANSSMAAQQTMRSVAGTWQAREASIMQNQSTVQEGHSSESYVSSNAGARPAASSANRVTIKTTSPAPECAGLVASAKGDGPWPGAKPAGLTGRDPGPSWSPDPQVERGDRSLEPLIAKGAANTRAMANKPAQHNQSQNSSHPNHSDEPQMIRYCSSVQVRSEQKATKVLGVVFFTFVFCWTPFFMVNFISGFVKREDLTIYISDQMMTTFLWLGYISSTINPVIYTVFNGNFRRAFRRLLLCREPVGRRPYRAHSRSSEYYKSFRFSQYHRPQNHLSTRQPMSLAIQHQHQHQQQQQVNAASAGKGKANSNDTLTYGKGHSRGARNGNNDNNSCSRARLGGASASSTMLTLDEANHQSAPTNADRLARDVSRERTSSDDSNRERRQPSTRSFACALRNVLRNSTSVILSRASLKRAGGEANECP